MSSFQSSIYNQTEIVRAWPVEFTLILFTQVQIQDTDYENLSQTSAAPSVSAPLAKPGKAAPRKPAVGKKTTSATKGR